MAKQDLNQTIKSLFESYERQLNGESKSNWHEVRKNSFASLQEVGFPDKKSEEYKYTPITRDLNNIFDDNQVLENKNITQEIDVNKLYPTDRKGPVLVFVNGVLNESLSEFGDQEGYKIEFIKDAFINNKELVSEYYNKLVNKYKDAFGLLNSSFNANGLLITVPDNTDVAEKFNIINILSAEDQKAYGQQRSLFIIGKNSSIDIAEYYYSYGEHPSFLNQLSEIFIGENSRVEFSRIGLENDHGYHIGNTFVDQKANSYFNASSFTFGGARVRNNLNITLDGEGIENHMNGLYLLNGNSHADHHTIVDHLKPHSESNELYKGILDDKSTGVFNGKIFVRQDAQKTNAFQSNKNILISDDATINAKPQLEIWADDVKCSHGCTTGQIDEESIFYMQSRGIDKKTAQGVMLHAFAGEVIDKVKDESIKAFLDNRLLNQLGTQW